MKRPDPPRQIGLLVKSDSSPQALGDASHRAVDAGFDGVEVDIGAADQLADAALTSHVVSTRARLDTCDAEEAGVRVRAWLERGAKLGARVLCLSMPPLQAAICTSGVSGHQDHDDVDGAVFARYQDALNVTHALLHELRFDAEAFGVPLVVEVAHGGCFLSPVELRDLIDRTNSWAIGACVDVDRVFRVGSPIDWIETLGRRVHCARVAVACDLSDPQFPRCSLSTVQDALRNGGAHRRSSWREMTILSRSGRVWLPSCRGDERRIVDSVRASCQSAARCCRVFAWRTVRDPVSFG